MNRQPIQQQLFQCVEQEDLVGICKLVGEGADVNYRGNDPDGETPLIRAVACGRVGSVRTLIEVGADVNGATKLNGWTPLMFALDAPGIMQELLGAGADVNVRTRAREISSFSDKIIRAGGETALHLAAAANNAQAVRALIQAGASIEMVDESGCTPLDVALKEGSPTEAAVALVEAGAKLTPERLEKMHSGAYAAHSNLTFFPSVGELDLNRGGPALAGSPTPTLDAGNSEDSTCPKCGALIYSRKARICGKCGALLSPKLRLSGDQQEIIDSQRKWARDLADAFGPTKATPTPCGHRTLAAPSSPTELLRRVSCAGEFKQRTRPGFWLGLWLSVLAGSLALAPLLFMPMLGNRQAPLGIWILAMRAMPLFTFVAYRRWQCAAPKCPSCGVDVKTRARSFCHFCGKALGNRSCDCSRNASVVALKSV